MKRHINIYIYAGLWNSIIIFKKYIISLKEGQTIHSYFIYMHKSLSMVNTDLNPPNDF
jgi:hypothetical protein